MSDDDKKLANAADDEALDETVETIALTPPKPEGDSEANTASVDDNKKDQKAEAKNSAGSAANTAAPHTQAPVKEQPSPAPKTSSRSWLSILLLLAVIALAVCLAAIVHFGQQSLSAQDKKIQGLANELSQGKSTLQQSLVALSQTQQAAIADLTQDMQSNQRSVNELSQRVLAQGKRLRAMSDTSRDDWLLAEAQYLLKLANQRIRIERSPVGAQALLEEADNILRDLDDPSLHPVRRAIAQDLAALKLLNVIDVEGIYVSLLALTDQVSSIPVRLSPSQRERSEQAAVSEGDSPKTFRQTIAASWQNFIRSFKDYVRVVHHEEKPKALLPVQDEVYLQQNLRLMLERAQLALLREQQDIYVQSLAQADQWLLQYYNRSEVLTKFREALAHLQEKNIVQTLPDISHSLALLHEYISELHQLADRKVPLNNAQKKTTSPKKAPKNNAAEAAQ